MFDTNEMSACYLEAYFRGGFSNQTESHRTERTFFELLIHGLKCAFHLNPVVFIYTDFHLDGNQCLKLTQIYNVYKG